jgi:hypothetical protein
MAFKNNKMICHILTKVAFTSKEMKKLQLMDYMVSLHFIDFISWGVLNNGPLYCITLWSSQFAVLSMFALNSLRQAAKFW